MNSNGFLQRLSRLPPDQVANAIASEKAKRSAEKAKKNLRDFVRIGWPIAEPGDRLIWNWHIDAISDHLEAVTRGEIRRLVINVPPGHAKSLIVSVAWPAWVWGSWPEWRGIFSSYNIKLAVRDSGRCRSIVESPWYADNFSGPGGWELRDDSNRKDDFHNTRTGFRLSLSVGSGATGFRGHCVTVDDPLNASDATSEVKLEEAIEWWDKTMSSRLNDPRTGSRVIIMQRLSEKDLSGHVLKQGGYQHLCLPSEFEPKRRSITYAMKRTGRMIPVEVENEKGETETIEEPERRKVEFFRDPRTAPGQLLFPKLYTPEVLAEAKRIMRDSYSGQHDQFPAPAEGIMFLKRWWRFWKPDGVDSSGVFIRPDGCSDQPARALPDKFDRQLISLDATFKDGKKNDRVCFTVIGIRKADKFVLEVVARQMSFTATIAEFRRLTAKYPKARLKLVEDKANGSAIIDTLKSEIPGIVAVEPEGGKEARASAMQPEVESGNIYLAEGAEWVPEFVHEFAVFPKGAHDDRVDSLSQAIIYLASSPAVAAAKGMANF